MIYCKNCSAAAESGQKFCDRCGAALAEENAAVEKDLNELNEIITENKKQEELPATAPLPYSQQYSPPVDSPLPPVGYSALTEPDVSVVMKILFIVITMAFFPGGIIAACVYMGNANRMKRSFGQTLLIMSLAPLALGILCCCVSLALGLSFGSFFNGLSEMYPYGF